VCGGPSVGKSSLVNLLTKKDKKESIAQESTTQENTPQECTIKGKRFVFCEILGFDLKDKKIFRHSKAQRLSLRKLLLNQGDGFNLVIHVQKKQSISETDQLNYEFIINEVFKKKIKTLCAISFSDEEEHLDLYWPTHEASLKHRGFVYDNGVAVCCGHVKNKMLDAILEDLRDQSYFLLWNMIFELTERSQKVNASFSFIKSVTSVLTEILAGDVTSFENFFKKFNVNYNLVEIRFIIIGSNDECSERLNKSFEKLGLKKEEDKHLETSKIDLGEPYKTYFYKDENFKFKIISFCIDGKSEKEFIESYLKYLNQISDFEVNSCFFSSENLTEKEKGIIEKMQKYFFDFDAIDKFDEILTKIYDREWIVKNSKNIRLRNNLDVYSENNWSNKVDLGEVFLDIHDFVLISDCFVETSESLTTVKNNNWSPLESSKESKHGYVGIAFHKEEQNKITIVIGHGKSRFNTQWEDILADIKIAESNESAILNEALEYEEKILKMEKFNDKQLNVTLIHTGFSLGGYIAASCAIRPLKSVHVDKMAVVLDAPGVKSLNPDEYKKYEEKIVNYFLVPNVINTCNKHVGKMFQIKSNLFNKNVDVEISCKYDSITACEQEFSSFINSHSLDLFKDLTRNYAKIEQVDEWPIAKNESGKN